MNQVDYLAFLRDVDGYAVPGADIMPPKEKTSHDQSGEKTTLAECLYRIREHSLTRRARLLPFFRYLVRNILSAIPRFVDKSAVSFVWMMMCELTSNHIMNNISLFLSNKRVLKSVYCFAGIRTHCGRIALQCKGSDRLSTPLLDFTSTMKNWNFFAMNSNITKMPIPSTTVVLTMLYAVMDIIGNILHYINDDIFRSKGLTLSLIWKRVPAPMSRG